MVNDLDTVNVIQLLRFENEFFSEGHARRPGDEAVLFRFSSLVKPRTSFIQEWGVNEWGGLTSEVSVLKTTFPRKDYFHWFIERNVSDVSVIGFIERNPFFMDSSVVVCF